MKIISFIKTINIFLFIKIFFNHFCSNRELESTDEILSNLIIILNQGFSSNKILTINKKYNFNITYVQPVIFYENYNLTNDSIILIEPKIILYINSKLYIPINSRVNYCSENTEPNILPVNIIMKINFLNITFDRIEDNSYIFNPNFKNDNFYENSEILFNYIENFNFFQKNEITSEEKSIFYELFANNITELLTTYPECDGLFFFNKIYEYILTVKKFQPYMVSLDFFLDNPEVIGFVYERYEKVDNIKLKVINLKISVMYDLCGESGFMGFCPTIRRFCTIKDILIYNNDIVSMNFEIVKDICESEDRFLILEIIKRTKEAIAPLL